MADRYHSSAGQVKGHLRQTEIPLYALAGTPCPLCKAHGDAVPCVIRVARTRLALCLACGEQLWFAPGGLRQRYRQDGAWRRSPAVRTLSALLAAVLIGPVAGRFSPRGRGPP